MTDLSNAQLSGQMSALLVSWQAREDQYRAWTGGTANGGPNADGRYQLTDSAGITRLVECPALLASTVSGPAAAALAHKLETIVARDVSISEATRAAAQRVLAEAALAAAVLARNQAQLARDQAQNSESNAAVHAETASVAASSSTAAYLGTQADREATTADAAAADADRILAQAAATAAAADRAAINPAQFATRTDGLSQIVGLQAALDAKLPSASFTWSGLAGKPSTFAPSAHSHVIADTTGLQTALDGKQASGSYAASAHSHVIADTTGLQTALDSKVTSGSAGSLGSLTVGASGGTTGIIYLGQNQTSPAYLYWNGGSYAMPSGPLLVNGSTVWTAATFDPATKANASHSHAMSDITGLGDALTARDNAINLRAPAVSPVFSGNIIYANGAEKLIIHHHAGGLSIAPSTADGTDWIWGQALEFQRANTRWNFAGLLYVQNNAVWHAGNFNPADKANAVHSHDWAQVTGKPNLLSYVSPIASTALDSAPDYGVTYVTYPGYSKTLLAFNPGGSVGQVQQEFFYNSTSAGYWRIRNKLDQTTWQPWKHVMLHDDPQTPLSGTVYTSTNLSTSVPALEAKLFNNGGVDHGTTPAGFGGRFFYSTGPNNTQAYGLTLGLGSNYAAASYSMDLAIPRQNFPDSGYLYFRNTEVGTVSSWAKIKAGYADSAGSLVGFNPADKANAVHSHDWAQVTGKPNLLSFTHASAYDWTPGTRGATWIGGWHGSTGSGDQYVSFGSTTGQLHWTIDGDYYANNGTSRVWHEGNFDPATKLDTSEVSTSGTANTVVRRTGNGYVVAPWFDASGGMYSNSSGVHFDVGSQSWGASLFANHSSVQLALRTAGAVTRGHVYADNGNTIGFLNNDANWALQLQKTGPSFLRVNNVLRSIWTSDDMAVHSSRDFVNGTLVTTDLNYPVSSGEAFILEIRGNGYGSSLPFDTVVQGYIYNNTLISVSGISNGAHITGMVALGVGGKLCFWWPRQAYWQGFNVKVYFAQAGEAARNRVMSITDVAKPSGTAEVDIAANVVTSWTSGNFDPGTKFNTAGGTLTGSISTTNGADRSLTLASSTSYNYQLITAGDHFHIREASDAAKVRLSISYPNGNVGIGRTGATSRLQVEYANPSSVPAAGTSGHAFAAGTAGYGLAVGVLTSGASYLQSTRWDGPATNHPLLLQPNGGTTRVGDDLQFDKVRSGMVGVYDAAQTQAIFAMGPSYTLSPGGASNQIFHDLPQELKRRLLISRLLLAQQETWSKWTKQSASLRRNQREINQKWLKQEEMTGKQFF